MASKHSTDPFWDKVIAASEVVTAYAGQRINITVKDQCALVWYEPEDNQVHIITWFSSNSGNPTESGEQRA